MDIKIGEMNINLCVFLFMLGLLAPVAAENKFGDHGIILTARPKDNADDYKQLLTIPETPRKVPDYPSRTFPGIKFDDVRMKLHACDVDYDQNMIYMYDYNYRTLIVGSNFSTSMNKDNINFTTEHYGISREYVKVAVDWVSHNVYWTDTVMGAIVMQPGGQGINQTLYKVIVNKDLDLPRGIAVDPISGYLFWSDFAKHSKIERASLIGEDRMLLVANALYIPDAITADHASQRIYFTNYQSIESVSYDGTDRKLLVKNTQAYFFDIAVYGDVVMATDIQAPRNLYFYDTATGKEAVPKEGSNNEDFYGVCMYHKDVQPSIAQDRCSTAGCEDICVDDPSKTTATCLCRTGFEVNADQKTCSSVGGQYHRAVVLNNGTHLCLLDIRILSDHHTHKVHCFYHHTEPSEMITYIDINGRTREVYFSTDTAIYRVPIDQKMHVL